MARQYVPSTPATRGEVDPAEYEAQASAPELTLEQLQAEAGKLGYELTVKKAEGEEPNADELPKGNASVEDWTAYALKHGKTEADLTVDGKPLGRDAIKALFEPEGK